MSKMAVFSLTALSLALGSAPVFAQSETAEGFIEGHQPVSPLLRVAIAGRTLTVAKISIEIIVAIYQR